MTIVTREDFESRYPARVPDASALPPERSAVLRGDLSIDADTTLRGVVGGNVVIRRGVQLNFHGVIKGSLTIEPGATVYMNGVVKRNLYLAGCASLIGVIGGDVRPKPGGEFNIEGVVKGRIIE